MTGETVNGMEYAGYPPYPACLPYPAMAASGPMSMNQGVPGTTSAVDPGAAAGNGASADAMPRQMPVQPQMSMGLPPLMLGTYTPKIDAKGRMALPAKMRAQLGTGIVMARGQERCVYLLPAMEFRRIAMQIQRTSMGDKAARDYLRVFLSGAVDQDPNKQGRVLVPQMLRDYANLGSDIVVIGVGTRAEIWNREAWETYLADKEQGYADIADDVLPEVGL